ncbi:YegP family protein [Nocardia sp. NPDC050378]|uniref:YegP family protein n=1 Tax=Nocardia sp. NPDC050378 TaxID=3155400 RepID=UPI0033DE156A
MAGKFELFSDAAGKVRWRLKAGNGEVIAQSQGYASKDAAKNGIASVQSNAAGATIVDLTEAAT